MVAKSAALSGRSGAVGVGVMLGCSNSEWEGGASARARQAKLWPSDGRFVGGPSRALSDPGIGGRPGLVIAQIIDVRTAWPGFAVLVVGAGQPVDEGRGDAEVAGLIVEMVRHVMLLDP